MFLNGYVKAVATPIDDAKVVIKFLKTNIFTTFGMPRTKQQWDAFLQQAFRGTFEEIQGLS